MANYDAQYESQLTTYRARQRLIVAKNINFKAPRADFKSACRAKLSKPASVRFFWRAPYQQWQENPGFVMLGFELRTDCRQAENDLKGFRYRNRDIKISRASRHAYLPSNPPAAPPVAAPVATAPVVAAPIITPPVVAAPMTTTPDVTAPAAVAPVAATPVMATPTTATIPAATDGAVSTAKATTTSTAVEWNGEDDDDSDGSLWEFII